MGTIKARSANCSPFVANLAFTFFRQFFINFFSLNCDDVIAIYKLRITIVMSRPPNNVNQYETGMRVMVNGDV